MNTPHPDPARQDAELRELVQRHKVYWEVRPQPTLNEAGEVVKTGFQIGLRGTFEHDHPLVAGSPECVEVFRDLRKIATGILPEDDGEPNYKIGLFENAVDFVPSSGRKDIEVTIRITSWDSKDYVDEDEVHSLQTMKQKLVELDVPEGRWRERHAQAHARG